MHHEIDRTPEPQRRPVMDLHDGPPTPPPHDARGGPHATPRPAPLPPGTRLGTTAVVLSASTSGLLVLAHLTGTLLGHLTAEVLLSPLVLMAVAPLLLGACTVVGTAAALHPGRPRRQGLAAIALTTAPVVAGVLTNLVGLALALLPGPVR